MSDLGKNPFGQPQPQPQPPGFGAFGSNIRNSNRPSSWFSGSSTPSSFGTTQGSFPGTSGEFVILSSPSPDPLGSFGPRLSSSAHTFPPTTRAPNSATSACESLKLLI
ncbi:hypothetical protein BGZ61DRAFT_485188 [Ilyonectria robusta]|uniref:uncharacterized protein n=1 Tax=Ilyonectria robusta TaxID=1079257 RepID=UPI001E8D62C8|nr:uncharacterized protein BGZ61DRAFT_485188 [Ilyonectria robusta]KAH8662726.1 hypothetical protein BGZ61DRAFT_485188 [Ilyonectria robusta]